MATSSFLSDVAGGFFGSDYLRDFNHASKIFRTDQYRNAPKNKFLFHVYFDINLAASNLGIAQGANYGLAVKTVKLPGFTFATHEMNQYNRKRIVQTKIKYDPIDITFHDDNGATSGPLQGGMIRKLWENYFKYYYNDSNKPKVQLGSQILNQTSNSGDPARRTQYIDDPGAADWGFISDPKSSNGVKAPFFNSITVFGFNQHKYVAYILVNPIITRFNHDTYSYSESSGTMENSMTVDYETVVYDSGTMSGTDPGEIVKGFAMQGNYDKQKSPLSNPGSQNTVFGQGGLLDAGGGIIDSLASGNILGAVKIAGTTASTFKDGKLTQTAVSEITTGVVTALNGTPNRSGIFAFPIYGSSPANK